jgi:multicomponent Na+:H+ antiporter subunit E
LDVVVAHIVSLGVTLFLLWLGLSGYFLPLLLSIGVLSTALVVFLAIRMEVIDHESHPIHLTAKLFRFWGYLGREIVLANIDVIKRILTPGKSISPTMVTLPLPQKSDLGRVVYANAITLTPGTVSVQLDRDTITVHALAKETADALATGEMASKVPDVEVPAK